LVAFVIQHQINALEDFVIWQSESLNIKKAANFLWLAAFFEKDNG
jgi:hypothetical protein